MTRPAPLARAQIVKQNLAKIGLDVEVKGIPPAGYFNRIARDEPFDIAFYGWVADYLDPFTFVNVLLDGRYIGSTNSARFDSPRRTTPA